MKNKYEKICLDQKFNRYYTLLRRRTHGGMHSCHNWLSSWCWNDFTATLNIVTSSLCLVLTVQLMIYIRYVTLPQNPSGTPRTPERIHHKMVREVTKIWRHCLRYEGQVDIHDDVIKGTFSVLLALSEGIPPVAGGFLSQRPVMQSFDVFFDLRLKKRLSKQLRRRWFGSHRAYYDVIVMLLDHNCTLKLTGPLLTHLSTTLVILNIFTNINCFKKSSVDKMLPKRCR